MNFLETICIQNGIARNLQQHVTRVHETAAHYRFEPIIMPDIENILPENLRNTKVKCRIVYREKIEEIEFEKYTPRYISSLKIVEKANIDYAFKFADRRIFQELASLKHPCDEIVISQSGCITDTSYSNVVFRAGNDFFTPDTYLLNGTKRQQLLCEKKIYPVRITVQNMHEFDEVFLINAMLDMEDGVKVDVAKICM